LFPIGIVKVAEAIDTAPLLSAVKVKVSLPLKFPFGLYFLDAVCAGST
jgi:hypothetical protein